MIIYTNSCEEFHRLGSNFACHQKAYDLVGMITVFIETIFSGKKYLSRGIILKEKSKEI